MFRIYVLRKRRMEDGRVLWAVVGARHILYSSDYRSASSRFQECRNYKRIQKYQFERKLVFFIEIKIVLSLVADPKTHKNAKESADGNAGATIKFVQIGQQ